MDSEPWRIHRHFAAWGTRRRVAAVWSASRAHSISLVGQASVSLMSFVATFLVGRFGSPGELGVYATGMTVLLVLLQAIDPLFGRPYVVFRARHAHEETAFAGGTLAMCLMFGLLAAVAISIQAAVFLAHEERRYALFSIILAATTPFWVARGFLRTFSVSKGRFRAYLSLDALSSGFQAACLAALVALERVGATAAVGAVGIASAAASARTLWALRGEFSFRTELWPEQTREFWAFGKWLLVAQVAVSVHMFASQWMLAAFAGAEAAGAYAAYLSIASLPNPFVLASANVLGAKLSDALALRGPGSLRQHALANAALLVTGLGTFCLFAIFLQTSLVRLLYPSLANRLDHGVVGLLALGQLFGAVGLPASAALAAMERPGSVAAVSLVSAAATLLATTTLTWTYGVWGAALGFLAGSAIGSVGRWHAFLAALRGGSGSRRKTAKPLGPGDRTWETVRRAVGALPGYANVGLASARAIGVGEQASAYLTEFAQEDGKPPPPLVVKLFREGWGSPSLSYGAVQKQYAAAVRLHMALASTAEKARAPQPLGIVANPLALALGVAPGKCLDEALPSCANAAVVEDVASALHAALKTCWERGFAHGDLTFDNVLCDLEEHLDAPHVSLIDPGTAECCPICDQYSETELRDVADIAHLSTDVTWRTRQFMTRPVSTWLVFNRRRRFVATILSLHLKGIADADARAAFMVQYNVCCREHVIQMFARDARLARTWYAFRRRRALRRLGQPTRGDAVRFVP